MSDETEGPDVAIVGAGLAGAAAAAVLARAGMRVSLIDPWPACPPWFKAEKIEPDQADLLRDLGLMQGLECHLTRIHEITSAHAGRVLNVMPVEQYGMRYQDLVNGLRGTLPPGVTVITARVQSITTSARVQQLTLQDGRAIRSRLVVIASGAGQQLAAILKLSHRLVSPSHSISFGFTIAPVNQQPFPFDALTYYSERLDSRIDYLSLFPIGRRMRANLFAYWQPRAAWVRRAVAAPDAWLRESLPGLSRITGPFRVINPMETWSINLTIADQFRRPGLVLIGDAYQTVCPATGSGVSKALTDVDVLRRWVPEWLATPGMDFGKINAFYSDPRKVISDRSSLQSATYRRRVSTDDSFRWRLHRRRVYLTQRLRGAWHRFERRG